MLNFDPVVMPSLLLMQAWGKEDPAEAEPSRGSSLHLESAKFLADDGVSRLVQMWWPRKPPGSPSCTIVYSAAATCVSRRHRGRMGPLVRGEAAQKCAVFAGNYPRRAGWLESG